MLPTNIHSRFSLEEIPYFKETLENKIKSGTLNKPYHLKEELEECVVHPFDWETLEKTLASYKTQNRIFSQPYSLYRIIANKEKNYIFSLYYHDVTSVEHCKVKIPNIKQTTESLISAEKPFRFTSVFDGVSTQLSLSGYNSSRYTLIRNIFDTLQKHQLFPEYSELWYVKTKNPKVKSFYIFECIIEKALTDSETDSVREDFERYLHHYIKPMSVFDIVGPSMVGPSSSHTAGANRIGQISRNILLAAIKAEKLQINSISVKLLGSFRDTGPGHKTPSAIGGGLWGLATDHPEMLAHGDPDFLKKEGIMLGELRAKFGGFLRGDKKDDERYRNDNNNNIAEIVAETNKGNLVITGFSIGGGNVEVRYINYDRINTITGKERFYFSDFKILRESEIKDKANAALIEPIYHDIKTIKHNLFLPFNSFEELIEYVHQQQCNLIDLILDVEKNLQGSSREEIFQKLEQYWKIMKTAIKQGIEDKSKSMLKLTGGDAAEVHSFIGKNSLFDGLYGKALAYAIAVNEINAKSGVIVACPTAGSCGLVPGVLAAYEEIVKPDESKLYEALLVAGFLGMLMFNDVSTAGADYGCQAEVGVGAAMAASALAYLENADVEKIVQAFTLAIKNSLGLICDPVAGLVEVPCVKRNGIFSSVAISAAVMALSGVKSFISPDEVVLTMKEVGEKLHIDYKETAGGGLAKTRDGKAIDKAFADEVERFFGN